MTSAGIAGPTIGKNFLDSVSTGRTLESYRYYGSEVKSVRSTPEILRIRNDRRKLLADGDLGASPGRHAG